MTIGRIPSVEGGIQPTIVTAKGDLIVATGNATLTRQPVGSDGQVLVADSTQADGVAWQSVATPFAAGKNKIINGDFNIWQRGTSFTLNGNIANNYTADRWNAQFDGTGATCTVSQQAFTPGTAPVAGYEGQYFLRWNRSAAGTSNTLNYLKQPIEDVRTLAGQTITLSFWAKADTNRIIYPQIYQEHGTGGTGSTLVVAGTANLTTSWQRFTFTGIAGNLAGKTIGPNSSLTLYFIQPTGTAFTIDYWGVQIEAGNVATPFATATGTLQGELAACQRYYETSFNSGVTPANGAQGASFQIVGAALGTGEARAPIFYKVPKRIAATVTFFRTTAGGTNNVWNYWLPGTGNVDGTSMGYDGTQFGFWAGINRTSGFTSAGAYIFQGDWVANAEL